MHKYLMTQVFSIVVSITLAFTFYALLAAAFVSRSPDLLTPMLLIVIAIILIAIFTSLSKMEYSIREHLDSGKKRKR